MSFNRHIDMGEGWSDPDNLPEERLRLIEEQVDARAKRKRLCECELPEGFALVTPEPKQFWMDHQLTWAFCLRWEDCYHIARYDWRVTDEVQLNWAIADLRRDIEAAGIDVRPKRGLHLARRAA